MKRRSTSIVVLGLAASLLGLSTAAGVAGDHTWNGTPFFLHLGVSAAPYDEAATVTMNGASVPGADISLNDSYSVGFELGYRLTPNFAIALSSGYPPTTTATATGSIAAYGTLGKATGGLIQLNGQYHFTGFGAFQPYIGAGPAYSVVLNNEDGALTGFNVSNAFGFDLQLGADWMLTRNVGIFLDLKKVFISTTASGYASGVPVSADVRLDPTIFTAGIAFQY